jgi:acyl-CoA synthetase (AMP-forming)/AMP-acid ligase II
MPQEKTARLGGDLLRLLGIGKRDRVSFLGQTSSEILELLFAYTRILALLVPLNARITIEQLPFFVQTAKPCCLFPDVAFLDTAKLSLGEMPKINLGRFCKPGQHRLTMQELQSQSIENFIRRSHDTISSYWEARRTP